MSSLNQLQRHMANLESEISGKNKPKIDFQVLEKGAVPAVKVNFGGHSLHIHLDGEDPEPSVAPDMTIEPGPAPVGIVARYLIDPNL